MNEQIEAKRQKVDEIFLSRFQKLVDSAIAAKANYEAACPCCRIAKVSNEFIRDTIGDLSVYDYGWTTKGSDRVYCPECGNCLWDKSS